MRIGFHKNQKPNFEIKIHKEKMGQFCYLSEVSEIISPNTKTPTFLILLYLGISSCAEPVKGSHFNAHKIRH